MLNEKLSVQKSGWTALGILILLVLITIYSFIYGIYLSKEHFIPEGPITIFVSALFLGLWGFMFSGLFTVEPNQAVALLLFGKYKGTEKTMGFRWANPLYSRKKISLRARNFDSDKLKVNDKKGNPIEISAVIVWHVNDTAQALFDVDDFIGYVRIQSESAIRHLATHYAYDKTGGEKESLRSSIDEVSEALGREIQERVKTAGVTVDEARINHLAYAPEIAHAMLQRQQAEAIIAARQKIVDGAVGMVEMALKRLKDENVIELDEERKASMVSNLMVVLSSDKSAQPIINTGSIY
ncbi:MAG: SPFH domain-containing protein [Calditrichaeota bacterium]|nr:MAG: SPFH domain-containing protein [Calditrichota bacterium]MBL1203827.1 SPFH domain-containing protein [Calditrichota bacterium]NOG43658.1 SPFH domain-containing protein [Calditrichota bacterium]